MSENHHGSRFTHSCKHCSLHVVSADMASAPAQQPTLTVEQTRGDELLLIIHGYMTRPLVVSEPMSHDVTAFAVVLSEVIQAFSVPENAARMEEARESACNDMGKMLQLVLPVATQIQQEVIKAYGFNNEGEGEISGFCAHTSS